MKNGWNVYQFEDAYEKQVSINSSVFVFKENDGTFTVWGGTWKGGNLPQTEKILISNVGFEKALERANKYVNWFRKITRFRR